MGCYSFAAAGLAARFGFCSRGGSGFSLGSAGGFMRDNAGGSGADSGLDARLVSAIRQHLGHANQRQVLAVALGALAGMLPAALDVVDGLFALDLVDDLGLDGRACNHRRANSGADHQDVVELDLVASGGIKLFNAQNVTRLHLVLLAAGLEDRKHGSFLPCSASFGPHLWAFRDRLSRDLARLRTARPSGRHEK
jgi:hypothetical protein